METETYKLKDILKIGNGKDHSSLEDGNFPVLGSGGIMRYANDYLYDGESVLLPRKGTLNNIQYIKGKFWTVDTCYYTIINQKIVKPYYLYRMLNSLDLSGLDSGASIPSMTSKCYYGIKVKVPDLDIQAKIANILSRYDETIENNNKRIKLLEQIAQNLYKEWFVRFRFPGWQNAEFENGIPKGWKVEKLGNLFEITSSKRVYENEYVESGIPFYRSKEIIELSNNQNVSLELYISDELYNRYKNAYGVPKESDILITSVGSIGNIYQVQKNDKFYFKDGNLTWIKSSKNKILSNYLVCWLQSDIGKSTVLSSTIGTSQSALTIENLKRIKILLPNESSLLKFSNIFSSIKKEIINLTISKQNLAKQRDLLLPRLMSGKLEVK